MLADRSLLLTSTIDVTTQRARERELYRLAYYDELTGVATRRLVESRVDELLAREHPENFALVFMDVDNFKNVNDYYGHSVGDALLKQFAQRIGFHLGSSDLLGRISGDEFLLLLDPVQDESEVAGFVCEPAGADQGPLCDRRIRGVYVGVDRRQLLSPARSNLSGIVPERGHRDVPGEKPDQGHVRHLRRQHGARDG